MAKKRKNRTSCRRESPVKILCPKCFRIAPRQGHHIYPQEYFGTSYEGNNTLLYLCETCHKEIDKLVHKPELDEEDCFHITLTWLSG